MARYIKDWSIKHVLSKLANKANQLPGRQEAAFETKHKGNGCVECFRHHQKRERWSVFR